MTSTAEAVAFWILGPLAVLGALALVFARKAVHAAMGMALAMVVLGILYIIQKADSSASCRCSCTPAPW